ncbi:MAG: hypothetical protein KC502_10240 [Myxococcales bacterium]|nr:hypothetical protein [Myxococcales bacterium]
MSLSFAIRNPTLMTELVPYVVATPFNLPLLDVQPFGAQPAQVIDPTRLSSAPFLDILHRLDGLTFGPEGMPMPKWVFYDCAEMPGAIYGLGLPANRLWPAARELFALPDGYEGIVPLSMYIAIPMQTRGVWFGHNLASAGPALRAAGPTDIDLRGLGSVTKGLALRCFGVKTFWGATQWLSKALFIHVKFGPLRLATAWTPAHSENETLTYGFDVTDDKLRASIGDRSITLERPPVDFWLDSSDKAAMQALQHRIEAGERFVIPSAPRHEAGDVRVPIAVVPSSGHGLGPGLGSE